MGLRRWCEARRFPRGPKAMFVLKVEFKPTADGEAFTVMSSLDLLNKVNKMLPIWCYSLLDWHLVGWEPEALMGNGATYITNAFYSVHPRAVRLMCYFHVKFNCKKRLGKISDVTMHFHISCNRLPVVESQLIAQVGAAGSWFANLRRGAHYKWINLSGRLPALWIKVFQRNQQEC